MKGQLDSKVDPEYPPLARQARIQGTVRLKALIDKEGAVKELNLISGHPMLAPAAIAAVRQWRYKPYLLNGEPVYVSTEIQVNFVLQGNPPAPDSDKKTPLDQTRQPSSEDSAKLEPIKIEKARYPEEAREKQLQGQVWLKIGISETGDVDNVEVISGDPVLAEAAVQAAKKWKFKPFIKNGKPIKVATKLPFDFAFAQNVHEEKPPPVDGTVSPAAGDSTKRVRISSGVSTGLLIYKVQPVYPPEARRAGIQGVVVLQAKISKEGMIADLQLISGPRELAGAAIGAVQQWRYRPYLLLGEPVEVDTQIQVSFTLSR
jgi:TonB family protein